MLRHPSTSYMTACLSGDCSNDACQLLIQSPHIEIDKQSNHDENLSDDNGCAKQTMTNKKKRKKWVKPADMPKRPLSAYNLFFRLQRSVIIDENESTKGPHSKNSTPLDYGKIDCEDRRCAKRVHRKTHGKISFVDLTTQIAKKWRTLDSTSRSYFDNLASLDRQRYINEMKVYVAATPSSKKRFRTNLFELPKCSSPSVKSLQKKTKLCSTVTPSNSDDSLASNEYDRMDHESMINHTWNVPDYHAQTVMNLEAIVHSENETLGLSDQKNGFEASSMSCPINELLAVSAQSTNVPFTFLESIYDPIPMHEIASCGANELHLGSEIAEFMSVLFCSM